MCWSHISARMQVLGFSDGSGLRVLLLAVNFPPGTTDAHLTGLFTGKKVARSASTLLIALRYIAFLNLPGRVQAPDRGMQALGSSKQRLINTLMVRVTCGSSRSLYTVHGICVKRSHWPCVREGYVVAIAPAFDAMCAYTYVRYICICAGRLHASAIKLP